MLFIKFSPSGLPIEVRDEIPQELKNGAWNDAWQDRNDWTSRAEVDRIARYLTAMTGDLYVGTERGTSFDIVRAPKVGDEVSYSFNGDTYPDGVVVKVTKTLQVKTSTGKTYRRHGQTGSWTNNAWSLIPGHIYEQNPHF